mmetsp:Transcript_42463/g.101000  ORF Transcript_42463/g.101000 Transcript_42463/m.101000 type:complete len:225 (-) Transcript_42463:235-909(-)
MIFAIRFIACTSSDSGPSTMAVNGGMSAKPSMVEFVSRTRSTTLPARIGASSVQWSSSPTSVALSALTRASCPWSRSFCSAQIFSPRPWMVATWASTTFCPSSSVFTISALPSFHMARRGDSTPPLDPNPPRILFARLWRSSETRVFTSTCCSMPFCMCRILRIRTKSFLCSCSSLHPVAAPKAGSGGKLVSSDHQIFLGVMHSPPVSPQSSVIEHSWPGLSEQ